MKKILILFAISTIAFSANAQFFIGGQFDLNAKSDRTKIYKAKTVSSVTDFSFTIGPRLGYCINEKWAVGADISLGPSWNIETYFENDDKKNKATETEITFKWSINPFVRYTIYTKDWFSVGVEGSIGVGCTHSSWSDKYKGNKEDNDKDKRAYVVNLQVFNIKPVMAFRLKEHIFLAASIDFLGFGYNIDIEPYQKLKNESTKTSHDFRLNITNGEMLKLGIVYQF